MVRIVFQSGKSTKMPFDMGRKYEEKTYRGRTYQSFQRVSISCNHMPLKKTKKKEF